MGNSISQVGGNLAAAASVVSGALSGWPTEQITAEAALKAIDTNAQLGVKQTAVQTALAPLGTTGFSWEMLVKNADWVGIERLLSLVACGLTFTATDATHILTKCALENEGDVVEHLFTTSAQTKAVACSVINAREPETKKTAFQLAAQHNDRHLAKCLRDNGASIGLCGHLYTLGIPSARFEKLSKIEETATKHFTIRNVKVALRPFWFACIILPASTRSAVIGAIASLATQSIGSLIRGMIYMPVYIAFYWTPVTIISTFGLKGAAAIAAAIWATKKYGPVTAGKAVLKCVTTVWDHAKRNKWNSDHLEVIMGFVTVYVLMQPDYKGPFGMFMSDTPK